VVIESFAWKAVLVPDSAHDFAAPLDEQRQEALSDVAIGAGKKDFHYR
jgi:hypothetical protein